MGVGGKLLLERETSVAEANGACELSPLTVVVACAFYPEASSRESAIRGRVDSLKELTGRIRAYQI